MCPPGGTPFHSPISGSTAVLARLKSCQRSEQARRGWIRSMSAWELAKGAVERGGRFRPAIRTCGLWRLQPTFGSAGRHRHREELFAGLAVACPAAIRKSPGFFGWTSQHTSLPLSHRSVSPTFGSSAREAAVCFSDSVGRDVCQSVGHPNLRLFPGDLARQGWQRHQREIDGLTVRFQHALLRHSPGEPHRGDSGGPDVGKSAWGNGGRRGDDSWRKDRRGLRRAE